MQRPVIRSPLLALIIGVFVGAGGVWMRWQPAGISGSPEAPSATIRVETISVPRILDRDEPGGCPQLS